MTNQFLDGNVNDIRQIVARSRGGDAGFDDKPSGSVIERADAQKNTYLVHLAHPIGTVVVDPDFSADFRALGCRGNMLDHRQRHVGEAGKVTQPLKGL